MTIAPFQPVGLPDLEEQRTVLAAVGLDVDDSILGPTVVLTVVPEPRQPGRIHIKERAPISSWSKRAKCRTEDPDRFFPTRHSTLDDVETAKAVCRTCPVRWACLEYSVQNWEKLGIWGGYTEIERREVRRDLRRQIAGGLDSCASSVRVYLEDRWGGLVRPIRRGEGHPAGGHPNGM